MYARRSILTLFAGLSIVTSGVTSHADVAYMVVADAVNLENGFDQAQRDRLEEMGYEVKVISTDMINSTVFLEDVDDADLLLVSESIGSSGADPLIPTTTPVMHNEAYGWDNWQFTFNTDIQWVAGVDVDIVDATHAISVDADVSEGSLEFFVNGSEWTTELVSALAPGAELIAQINVDGNDRAIIFAIEEGEELADFSAASRRSVGFSLPGTALLDASEMTDEAWALWDAAIRWLDPPSVPPDLRPTFHRGDTNDDGTINIADVVGMLNLLFAGGDDTSCKETQDFDNDGNVVITDAVAILLFLFSGGPDPAPPGATDQPCGQDPDAPNAPGDLGCNAYTNC